MLCGEPHQLRQEVDEHDAKHDVFVQKQRDKTAAKRLPGSVALNRPATLEA